MKKISSLLDKATNNARIFVGMMVIVGIQLLFFYLYESGVKIDIWLVINVVSCMAFVFAYAWNLGNDNQKRGYFEAAIGWREVTNEAIDGWREAIELNKETKSTVSEFVSDISTATHELIDIARESTGEAMQLEAALAEKEKKLQDLMQLFETKQETNAQALEETQTGIDELQSAPIFLQLKKPGAPRDPAYNQAAERIKGGMTWLEAYKLFLKETNTKDSDKNQRDSFKSAMKRRGVEKDKLRG